MMQKDQNFRYLLPGLWSLALLFLVGGALSVAISVSGSSSGDGFEEGEKLTYNVSFEQFKNVAYAEVLVASKGTIGERTAVELKGKVKSLNLFSAAFYLFDQSRTVFASAESGLPLYIRDESGTQGIPVETVTNYLSSPSTDFDLLTLLYAVRKSGGAGSFTVIENGKTYSFDFATSGGEQIKTEAGSFETTTSGVTGSYLTEHGITDAKISFTIDEKRIPVAAEFRTSKGLIRAELASQSNIRPVKTPESTVSPVRTPTPIPTPTPVPTPTPFVENQPLPNDLPFKIGEKLVYSVKSSGQESGTAVFSVDSRKLLNGEDTLVLKITGSAATGAAEVWVDPTTLVPRQSTIGFSGPFAGLSHTATFDQGSGVATFGNSERVDIPVGTHSLHSFVYAVRSFNLKPSKDSKNPINDTRVAVFVKDRPLIFTLRPGDSTLIDSNGRKVSAQMVTIVTGDGEIDRYSPKIWLSNDGRRVPLRITFGTIQADLVR